MTVLTDTSKMYVDIRRYQHDVIRRASSTPSPKVKGIDMLISQSSNISDHILVDRVIVSYLQAYVLTAMGLVVS